MNSKSGFTLIEIMVVVIIIAALAAMIVPRVIPAGKSAKIKITEGSLANIGVALKMYHLHVGRYPSTDEGLDILLKPNQAPDWQEPFLDKQYIEDSWQNKFYYKYPGTYNTYGFDVWSSGPDGENNDGSGDDIMLGKKKEE